jgi:hydroxymethylbilane synthase
MPLAAHAIWSGDTLSLSVALGHALTPASPLLRARQQAVVQTDAEACALGEAAAQSLRDTGASAYLVPAA